MADCMTKCINANTQVSGRCVTRIPNSRLFTIDPKINTQVPSAVFEAMYEDRFDERAYYFDINSSGHS